MIILDGNLIIETSGELKLDNCTLIMNCSSQNTYSIYVEGSLLTGGEFNGINTLIQSADSNYPFVFSVNMSATMNMKGCTVKNLGGELNISDPLSSFGGIQIHSSNVLIEKTNVTDYETIGIMVMPYAAPTIKECNIYMNPADLKFTVGILDTSAGLFSPTYRNNYIYGNLISGFLSVGLPIGSTFATVSGNTFEANTAGVSCWGTDPDISNNDFTLNVLTGIAIMDCDSDIWGNRIELSASGISVLNPCQPNIHDNIINSTTTGLLLYNGTDARVHKNNISDNLVYSISTIGSEPTIYENDLYNNLLGGIYLDDASAVVRHNDISSDSSSALTPYSGIIIRNESGANIYQNNIYTGDFGTGIDIDGNLTSSLVLDRNSISVGTNGTCINIMGFSPRIFDNHFYYDQFGLGINALRSSPQIRRNYFNGTLYGYGANIASSDVILEDNIFHGNEMGVYAYNSTTTLIRNQVNNNTNFGFLLNKCEDVQLDNNLFGSVNKNPTGEHNNIEIEVLNSSNVFAKLGESYLRLLNSTYQPPTLGPGSIMQVDWFLDIIVKNIDKKAVKNVPVALFNNSGQKMYALTMDDNGMSQWNQVTEKNFTSMGSVEYSPYNIKAKLGKKIDNKTVYLNSSKKVFLNLDYNYGPTEPSNILPVSTHNRTPIITWSPSVDPESDPIYYHLSIGTTKGAKDIIADHNTPNPYYQVQDNLNFLKYHITITAYTPDGNSSKPVNAVLDVFNNPPILSPIGDIHIYLDIDPHLRFFLNATDPNTDPIDILKFNASTSLFNINADTGEINWTADEKDIGTHQIEFSVTDGFAIDFELINITISYKNKAPIADAGFNITVYLGQLVFLNASDSYDTDGSIAEYKWSSEWLSLLNTTDPIIPLFKPESIGNYTFELTVRDNNGAWSKPDTVLVTVLAKKVDVPKKVPRLILLNASVDPKSGKTKDIFVFSITVVGVNITSDLIEAVNAQDLIHLELDEKIILLIERKGNISELSTGIEYSLHVSGKIFEPGAHIYRFLCNFENVSGDIGIHSGPTITAVDKPEGETEFNSGLIAIIVIALLVPIIVIIVILFLFLKKRLRPDLQQENPEQEEKPVREKIKITKQVPMQRNRESKQKEKQLDGSRDKKSEKPSDELDIEWDD
jgi:parallel beta-helix repeat protein